MAKNASLHKARAAKNDEFYTQLTDIEKELKHYKDHFRGKTILCNCDDPRISNFFHYFSYNFEKLKLKKLVTTCYKNQQRDLFTQHKDNRAIYLEYDGFKNDSRVPDPNDIGINYLDGDGDFRSQECIALLERSDIVVTNPPFSLFREYVAHLMKHDKKFIIVGNQNNCFYKEIFPLIEKNKMWFGFGVGPMTFRIPSHYKLKKGYREDKKGQKWMTLGTACWFTNLDIDKRHEELILYKKYDPKEYPKYDNYDAINVNRVDHIPMDYDGIMGVPITFLNKHNPDQFDIVGNSRYHDGSNVANDINFLNGKSLYARILIRRKK